MIKQNNIQTLLLLTYELKQREEIKQRALNDFTYFLHEILGFDFLNEPEHHKWIEWLISDKKRKFIMASRGSGKSTMITVAYSLWRLINDNNLRILIVSATEKLSKKFLYQIKVIIENNRLFIRIFGNIIPKVVQNRKWDTTEIRIEGKTKYRESNIKCCGITKPPTGDHVDLLIGDDIINMDDCVSTALREEKKIKFREICSNILTPEGESILIGTTWHDDDLHQAEILAKNKQYKKELQWDIMISPAKLNNKLVFPELLNEDKLKQARIELGYSMFQMQYYLEIIPENTLFSLKNITYYDYSYYEENKKDFIIGIGIDLAEKTKDVNDYTAIIVLGYHRKIKNKFYVLDEWVERLTPTMYIDIIIQYYLKWKPNKLVIENNNFGGVLISMLKKEAKERNINLPIVSFRNSKNKDVRIRSLEPLMNKINGTIAIPKQFGQLCPRLIDQLIKYDGKSGFDDAPDGLELIYRNMQTVINPNLITVETHGKREWTNI